VALIQCDFYSDALSLSTSMSVILPQQTRNQIGMAGVAAAGRHPTLWLLHGYSDDHTIWCRRTSIERYVSELGLAVIMPAVHHSYYSDIPNGMAFWEFVSEELPAIARGFFPLSDRREDNYVAGLSMGGFGALKLALHHPHRYAAAASLSGAVNPSSSIDGAQLSHREKRVLFGDEGGPQRHRADLAAASRRVVESGGDLPALYLACGLEDGLLGDNREFVAHLRDIDYPVRYEEDAGRDHTWDYWDETIQRVLDWLPLPKRQ